LRGLADLRRQYETLAGPANGQSGLTQKESHWLNSRPQIPKTRTVSPTCSGPQATYWRLGLNATATNISARWACNVMRLNAQARLKLLTHAVTGFMKARGGKVRLHGLRHSHASHMLAANVHPKIVQERFGHSSVATTMDIYSHLMPNMQEDAAAKVDAALQAAIKAREAKGAKGS
jgi:integrase